MPANASKMDGAETHWKCRLKANPKITLDELALKLGKSRRTVTRIIKRLQEENIIFRIGSDKTGYWEVKNGYKFPLPVRASSLIER